MAAEDRLTAEELAAEALTSVPRIEALVDARVLAPRDGAERPFERGDVLRVTVANALEEGGLTLEQLRRGIDANILSFDDTPRLYPELGPLAPGTVRDLAAELGLSTDALLRVITALGLPRPEPDAHLRQPDEQQLRDFVAAWGPLGGEAMLVRAARVYGDALRRATEGWMRLFEEAVLQPVADRVLEWDEMSRYALEPGFRMLHVGRTMLPWLLDHSRTPELNRLNFESIERQLAMIGVAPAAPRDASAIVFADLAGYTRLTEERGDEVAAASAMRLAEVADGVAQRHSGRLVKLLGDGVMLWFARPEDAVAAAAALRDEMAGAGLPPAHTGIEAGAVIRRESDFFGRTVNIAARLAGVAGPGEVLLTDAVRRAVQESRGELPGLVEVGGLELKGIPEPVVAFRLG